jgi:putative DNA primase/helicase
VAVALRHDTAWRGVIGRNEFTGRIQLLKPPPWRIGAWIDERDWTDDDDLKATEWVQDAEICAPKHVVSDAVESVANENPFHPVRDWLNDLQWDGRESRRLKRVGRKLCIRAWRHFFHDEVRTTAKLAGINMVML